MPKPSPKLKQLVRWVNCWKKRLLLDTWSVSVEVVNAAKQDGQEDLMIADITVTPRYSEAKIRVYEDCWKQAKELQEATIVHELIHTITNPARSTMVRAGVPGDKVDDIIETMTEHFAKIVYRAYKKGGSVYPL